MQPKGVLKHSRTPILCYGPTVKVWHVQTRNAAHRMTMLLRREIAHFDNLQRTNISTEMTACEGT
jgi:hypothetical protein